MSPKSESLEEMVRRFQLVAERLETTLNRADEINECGAHLLNRFSQKLLEKDIHRALDDSEADERRDKRIRRRGVKQ